MSDDDNYKDIKLEEMETELNLTPSNIELGLTLLLKYSESGQRDKYVQLRE